MSFQIVDPETRKTLARGETGEVCVRGPQMMKGYLNNEKATRDMIDDDGWLYTGIIGPVKQKTFSVKLRLFSYPSV